jgi:hypothetical protein
VIRCPSCNLPITDSERRAGVCPACGVTFTSSAAPAPAPVSSPLPATYDPSLQAAAIYRTTLQVAPDSVIVLERQWPLRAIAVATLVACLVATLLDRPVDRPEDPTVGAIVVGAATGLLIAAIVFLFLLGNSVRWVIAWFAGGTVASGVIYLAPLGRLLPVALAGALGALVVVLRESSMRTIRIRPDGIEWVHGWPRTASHFLAWQRIETVTADLKTIRTTQFGQLIGVRSQSRLRLRGGGQRIDLKSSFYPSLAGGDHIVINYCRPAAMGWTIKAVQEKGSASLGSLRLYRDRIRWRRIAQGATAGFTLTEHLVLTVCSLGIYGVFALMRLIRGWEEIALTELRQITLVAGELVLDGPRGKRVIPIGSIANGPYLVDLVRMQQTVSV